MRRLAILAVIAGIVPAANASAVSPRASCVAVITSVEASQLAPGFVGAEVSGLAGPDFGSGLVAPLAGQHLATVEDCRAVEA
jgi:hypothetical protein